ncbi:MFS transporter [Trinickia sp. NRRL B-1857]|uniref:MFS transporter n=1 Tax=Trinickia sp. NRRL B-1857 TaxID=3162879 RepID=UPI003D2B3CEC
MQNIDISPSKSGMSLYIATILTHTALTGGRVAVSLSAIGAHTSPLTLGILIALFAVFPMLLALHTGRWIDRIGIQAPLFIGVGLATLGCLGPVCLVSTGALIWASSLIGAGFMVFQVAMQNLLGQSEPSRRLHNFSRLAVTQSVSAFSGPLLVGGVLGLFGYRMTFAVLALLPATATAILLTQRAHLLHATGGTTYGHTGYTRSLLTTSSVRRILIANTVLSGAWDTHAFMLPLYGAAIGLSATRIGTIMSAFALAAFFARLSTPFTRARLSSATLLALAMACAAGVFMLYPLVNGLEQLLALSFLLGIALGTSQPNVMALLHEVTPPQQIAEAIGLRIALVNLTQFAVPLGFGALGSTLGTLPLFWGYAFVLAASIRWRTQSIGSRKHPRIEKKT